MTTREIPMTPQEFTANQRFWVEVYNRFELDEPIMDPRRRATREYSPRANIVRALQKPYGKARRRFLMIGTVGTGKTTELYAIAEAILPSQFVVLVDLWRHFDESVGNLAALQHVEPWEVLLLVGLAVFRAAEVQLGHAWRQDQRSALDSAVKAFFPGTAKGGPSVDLGKLTASLVAWVGGAATDVVTGGAGTAVGVGLKLLSGAAAGAKWDLPLGRRSRDTMIPDEDPRLERLLGAVNDLLRTIQTDYRGIALFVDGLDRITEAGTIRDVFVESRVLAKIDCNMVLTGPIALRQDGIAHMVVGLDPKVLANVPVLKREDPKQHGSGVAFMRDLFNRRVDGLEAPAGLASPSAAIPEALLDTLAYYSGGRARDFIRLIRDVADRAVEADIPSITAPLVDECIDERRRVIELGITRADVDLLQAVEQDEKHLLPSDPRVADLLNRWLLLPYPNESEWYFPHPLLTINFVSLA